MPFFVFGEDLFNLFIKLLRMIHMLSVAKLVNNNAVYNFFREQNKQTVKIKIPV